MRKLTCLFAAMALAFAAVSCTSDKVKDIQVNTKEYVDTNSYLSYSLKVDLPTGTSDTEKKIKDQLMAILEADLSTLACFEDDERLFVPYDGDKDDIGAYLGYVSENTDHELTAKSYEMMEEARQYSDDYCPPAWGCDAILEMVAQTDKYIVFKLFEWVYYGGAHGGVLGKGHMTFSKSTGELLEDAVEPSKLADIQPLLVEGLNEYMSMFSDGDFNEDELFEWLFVDDQTIPLPDIVPYPSPEGWTFTYREYEIGPYAMGMPEFTISHENIKPFLTKEAEALTN